jgi:hypothetical protein
MSERDISEILAQLRIGFGAVTTQMGEIGRRLDEHAREIQGLDDRVRACELSGRAMSVKLGIGGLLGGALIGVASTLLVKALGG